MSESRLESLPKNLLVVAARKYHFNFTTPKRSGVGEATPPAQHLSLHSRGSDGKVIRTPSPHSPPAAPRRRGPRSRLNFLISP